MNTLPILTKLSPVVLTVAVLLMAPRTQAQVSCESIFSTQKISQTITAREDLVLNYLEQERVRQILSLEIPPKWEDFNALSVLKDSWKYLPDEGHSRMAEARALDVLKSVHKSSHTFGPAEYGLQVAYRETISEILPSSLKKFAEQIPRSDRHTRIDEQAQSIIQNINIQFEKLFPTTGFKSYAEYKEAVLTSENPALIDAFKLLESGNFDLSIRRPTSARFWIPKVGFQNQFVTRSSRGYYTPSGRNHCESGWTGVALDAYEKMLPEAKPKYGSIRPKPNDVDSIAANSEDIYGEDIFILKKENLLKRLTFNIGDTNSLVAVNTGTNWEQRVHNATSWDQSFIPWEFRGLLAPFLDRKKFGFPSSSTFNKLQKSWKLTDDYFEIQIFGELKWSDIESYQFQGNPPSGEFLELLQKHKIKIYDATQWPPKQWTAPK